MLIGAVSVGYVATQRESNVGIRPIQGVDHWHAAYSIYNCGQFAPVIQDAEHGAGVHSHQDGIVHVHPSSPQGSGTNATIGVFFEAASAELGDDTFNFGATDGNPTTLSEEAGCNGEPATLQVAFWDNALAAQQGDPPDRIVTEDLANVRFMGDIGAFTVALVPEGTEIPPPETIDNLATLSDI